ncbi:MFS transporter [Glycomyces algeriensis]|uniref:MFS transporter n=1 Tax=Glycomyces algeriensis TaxID=256037 RepID=A0A9W6LHV6_9ACTN|nr:MFS transporter [Glycomyces algeriensis]MDA1366816.1 MFS transporter [Glycomyces algeriensis]MDA1368667.1 MFS transporter [Glycomyces algeriensis]MDR7351704.1 EmrB/QacA subfamily drug resistance transporter [Glycomyces algeriensis]GLI44427.1 MFS transporter [Glycomyces algeriensis]
MTSVIDQQGTAPKAVNRTASPLAILAVALSSLTLPLAVTGPAVALTDMAVDLRAGIAETQWVQNAYGVTFAACLLAAGALADRHGRRRVMISGLWLFAAMSALCAVAQNMILVDIARALQGIGAAGVLTSGAAVLAASFTGAARAKAFGVLGASFGCGLALGPLTAGMLVNLGSWRLVFLLNVAIALFVLLFLARHLPESRDPDATSVDWAGLATFSGSLALLTLVFVEGPVNGWTSTGTLSAAAGSVLLLLAFVVVELRQARPVFDLSLLAKPSFIVVMCQPFTVTFGFVVLLVYLPPYFQGVSGHSALASGALLLPLTLPVLSLPLVAGRLAARIPLRVMLAASSSLIAAGSLWLTTLQPGGSLAELIGPLALFGIGVGSAFGVMDNAAVGSVPVERAGMASGMFNTMRITGETIAIAGAAALLSSLTLNDLRDRAPVLDDPTLLAGDAVQGRLAQSLDAVPEDQREVAMQATSAALTSAMHVTLILLAVLAIVGAISTFAFMRDHDLSKD